LTFNNRASVQLDVEQPLDLVGELRSRSSGLGATHVGDDLGGELERALPSAPLVEQAEHATLLENLLLARHAHKKSGFFSELLFLPSVRRLEIEHREAVEKAIDFLDLQQYRDSLIVNLPYGVRKVTELARALCTDPRLLLLDEPSSGLNVEETEDMAFWIQDIRDLLGITVLMVEHDMSLVSAVSDRVLALNYGRPLAMGTPAEVQAHPEVIRAYLGG